MKREELYSGTQWAIVGTDKDGKPFIRDNGEHFEIFHEKRWAEKRLRELRRDFRRYECRVRNYRVVKMYWMDARLFNRAIRKARAQKK